MASSFHQHSNWASDPGFSSPLSSAKFEELAGKILNDLKPVGHRTYKTADKWIRRLGYQSTQEHKASKHSKTFQDPKVAEERWVVLWVQLEDRSEENSQKRLEFREGKGILTTLRIYAKKGSKANIPVIDGMRFMFEEFQPQNYERDKLGLIDSKMSLKELVTVEANNRPAVHLLKNIENFTFKVDASISELAHYATLEYYGNKKVAVLWGSCLKHGSREVGRYVASDKPDDAKVDRAVWCALQALTRSEEKWRNGC
jgi:hypothetical protein